jgi:hypothetical protein
MLISIVQYYQHHLGEAIQAAEYATPKENEYQSSVGMSLFVLSASSLDSAQPVKNLLMLFLFHQPRGLSSSAFATILAFSSSFRFLG